MDNNQFVLSALSSSTKGQLKYDHNWHNEGRIKEILEECTSPPKITSLVIRSPPPVEDNWDTSLGVQDPGGADRDCDNRDTSLGGLDPAWDDRDCDNRDTSLGGLDPAGDDQNYDNEFAYNPNFAPDNDRPHTPREAPREVDDKVLEMTGERPSPTGFVQSSPTGLGRSDVERRVVITERTLQEEEDEYRKIALSNISERRRLYDDHTRLLQRQVESQYNSTYRDIENVIKQETRLKAEEFKQVHDEINQKQLKLREEHKRSATVLDNKIIEAQNKQREEEERERKKQQAIKDRLTKLEQARDDFLKVKTQVMQTINNCSNPDGLPEAVRKYPDVMLNLSNQVEGILEDVRKSESNAWNVDKLMGYLSKAQDILEFVRKQVEQAEKVATEELEQKKKEQQQKELLEQQRRIEQQKLKEERLKQQQQLSTSLGSASRPASGSTSDQGQGQGGMILMNSVYQHTLLYYTSVTEQQLELEKRFHKLTTDPQLKKGRFELQKAVNTPINSISSESGRHLRDKLDKIIGLLSGQSVTIGEKSVCARGHEGGIDFCMNLFAKKMVSQGDTQVSAQYEAAFAFAAVIVGVWCELPVVGELLMAHFYQKCPYLAPYYIPMKEGQTAESYYSSLGYSFEDNQQEKQDMFLKRMSGLMRLYASVFVTSPPRSNCAHPHGLDKAWCWLTQVVTLDPRPDITATLLHDFLEVTAHALLKQYKRQFLKVVEYMIRDYMPRIRAATLQGAGGPVSRLEIYLEKIHKGQISQPKGMLPSRFWIS